MKGGTIMCGICGFMGAGVGTGNADGAGSTGGAGNDADDHAILAAMCGAMAHRGPDGEGHYVAESIALGHRRLALVDLGRGGQPMVRQAEGPDDPLWSCAVPLAHDRGETARMLNDEEAALLRSCRKGRYAIVFNGEIYNYQDLRGDLQELGYVFTTESDTEVLLVGYIAWGEAVLDRVRGMFAFAIYDAQERELFCARDFFGIKPFYYTVQDGRFIFASEIKCILQHPAYERAVNEKALAQYLCFQFSALDETFFKGVFKLPPGHWLRVRLDGEVQTKRYWQPVFKPDSGQVGDRLVQAIGQTMRQSVQYHNVADVEVGSFLSSGIDSSYLAALLAQENPDIKTFTVGFSEYEGERDEVSWASELAQMLSVENDAEYISEDDFWEALPTVQWHMDEPSADPSAVALYFVDRCAAQRVKAVLSGEGADEFFGGYRIYQAPLASGHASMLPKPLLKAGSKALRAMGKRGANYLERASEHVEDWYYTNANGVAFSPTQRDVVLASGVCQRLAESYEGDGGVPSPQELTAPLYAEIADLDEPTRMQYVDLAYWLVGDILLKTDKMSMAHSLESRVPFLDREVFALAATIPLSEKVSGHQTKIALRQAAERTIPREWAQKEKLGFPVPLASWLRKDAHYDRVREAFESDAAKRYFNSDELMRLLDDHRTGKSDNARRIWIVYSFLVWYEVYFNA